jgi:4-amino-4-deoxy-L-arabinose transferase-like glycosyltransferase
MASVLRFPKENRVVLSLAVIAGVVALTNLQHSMLWQDEAQTALISRTVLGHGIPIGTDGQNFFSQEAGAEYAPGYVWRWHTWLPFYVLAGFFGVFGEGTFVARLPFALCGIATVVMTYKLAEALWHDRKAALAAGMLLALSVPFLILARQCRYYSMTALFTVVSLFYYTNLMRRERYATAGLVVALLLLFHTHYVYLGALVAALVVHAAWWHRDRLRALGGALGVVAVFCLPWVIWFTGMPYCQQYGRALLDPAVAWESLQSFAAQLEAHAAPWWALQVPVIVLAVHALRGTVRGCLDRELWNGTSLLLLAGAANVALLSLVVPGTFFRYLTPILPVMALLLARVTGALAGWHWSVGLVFVAALVGRQPVAEYVYELTHDFNGPVEGIADYLNEHARDGDVVGITYEDMPLKFYTPLRVIGGLTGEDLRPAEDAQWLIIRRYPGDLTKDAPVRKFLNDQLRRGRYEKIVLDSPDTRWQNREDLALHLFRTALNEEPVVIWRRVDDPR